MYRCWCRIRLLLLRHLRGLFLFLCGSWCGTWRRRRRRRGGWRLARCWGWGWRRCRGGARRERCARGWTCRRGCRSSWSCCCGGPAGDQKEKPPTSAETITPVRCQMGHRPVRAGRGAVESDCSCEVVVLGSSLSSSTQSSQPSGAGGHEGSGCHPSGGSHPSGGVGQVGGGLKRAMWSLSDKGTGVVETAGPKSGPFDGGHRDYMGPFCCDDSCRCVLCMLRQ